MTALTLPGIEVGAWQVRTRLDRAANALADRHYSRRRPGSGQVGPPGRKLVLVSPDETALWLTHWPYAELAMDGLDAWRCSIFRNEGPVLSSDLIRAAMDLTERLWEGRPADGWVTWVDTRKVRSSNPGCCFLKAGWYRDRGWSHRYLIRFRACNEGSTT
jgi:hypothetical protein